MSVVLTLERTPQPLESDSSFMRELIDRIRIADKHHKYSNLSDEMLLEYFVNPHKQQNSSTENLNLDPLYQILVNAFYNAIAVTIERKTRHHTEAFIHLKNKEFCSAVISCGGVLVLYSLMWGYRNFGFPSLQELVTSAETNINLAVTKASRYLDF